ncbi:MAG: hypothetical protein IJ258_09385 [Methanobrevibacter sp.]|uniref:hypothetical protein n=1 Tax=Methanobrevibacter sp. TaxID=66852 RepID=UPI0025D26664|nr:hypothetical protein [Methanobrevibacter sp.]MBQ8018299.1 hypothetical protein [Methanobrevibacter sp.]
MKMNKILFVFSISIILLASMSLISASTNENLTLTDSADSNVLLEDASETYSSLNLTSVQSQDDKIKSANDNYIINQRNYKMYFDEAGVLKNEYSGKILTFDGTFTDKGILTINSDNTKITGRNTLFNNTGFNIKADGVMLTNLKFVLNESFTGNSNAGIYITGNNVTLYNIDMSYDTPSDVDAIGVYSYDNTGFKLINSSFNYIGHAFHEGHNYPILLQYSDDALVSGNDISSTLPLREVDWSGGIYGGVGMDKVSSFAAGDSKNLQFTGNNVYSTVNFGEYADNKYPTLSSVLIYACDNSTINKNDIKVEDLHTRKNTANYLYALDIYRLNDVEVVENNIDVFTYGGNGRYGTAYPIQVTGPAYNIKVAYNYLHSVSNGPNIGVYSQNYYGSTQIDVISNFINITGKAGTDSWALVAGIEVQDSDDRILNNTIIVDTVGGYKAGDRVYGISYSQNTQGNHKYDIKYNKVTTPGPIAISLNQGLGSTTSDTNVMYNILVTGVGEGGDRAVSIGGNGQNNVVRYNTNGADTIRHMSERDIPSWLKNYNSGGVGNGNGVDLSWLNTGNNAGNGLGNGEGSGNSLSGKGQGSGLTIKSKVNGNNINPSTSDAIRGDANSTRYTYGESGISIASASSSAGSGSSSSSSPSESKAYEITKQIQELDEINYIQTIIGIILVLILLIIGYREKERTEEEY